MPYPGSRDAIGSVLRRLGIDPSDRIDAFDQDEEYTSSRHTELPEYFHLYGEENLTVDERAVLCCFLLESLNECIQAGEPHPLQASIFAVLFANRDLHAAELGYWMNTSDPDEDNWWPITRPLLDFEKKAGSRE